MAVLPVYCHIAIFLICLVLVAMYKLRRKNISLMLLSVLGGGLAALKFQNENDTLWVSLLVIGFMITFVLAFMGLRFFKDSK